MTTKDQIQKDVLNTWWKAGCIGTAELTTGFGKSKVGVMACAYFAKQCEYQCKILIIVPTTTLKDEWRKEFSKWKETKTFKECVQVECINTARKFKDQSYSLVICDEIHNYIGGQINLKFFKNNDYARILGLSATIEDNLLDSLNRIAPICYTLDLYQAVELGLVSDFTIYNIPVELTVPERKAYMQLSSTIDMAWQQYGVHSWKNIGLRTKILYNASAKIKTLQKLIKMFGKDSHGIVFSMTKEYSDAVKKKLGDICVAHHSGIGKKARVNNLNSFADGRTKVKVLSSAKTLDEGVNLPRLKYAIIMASSSKTKQQRQRVGRCVRIGEDGKHAVIIRLYCRDTKEEQWLDSSQANLNVINVNGIEELIKLIKTK